MWEFARTWVRYEWLRIRVLLRRVSAQVNAKQVYRHYLEEGSRFQTKTPKRNASAKPRKDRCPPAEPGEVWAKVVIPDQMLNGCRIQFLTIADAFS